MIIISKDIKAILFDSGRVLNMPATGNWFISPNFFQYVDKSKYKHIPYLHKRAAFKRACEYISKQNLISTEEEEYMHFLQFYKIFFGELNRLKLAEENVEALAKDLVYNYSKYTFFDDALELIPQLSKTYKLAVVSDAWPSLENVFKSVNLRDYFSSFVISSVKGVTKPHKSMYDTALEELNVKPEEAIFIDDNIKNCDGASILGINSILINRNKLLFLKNRLTKSDYKVISNLHALKPYIRL